jgi:thioredoxin-like negative regulator of GroEL
MTSALCLTLIQAAMLTTGADAAPAAADTYAAAHRTTTSTGKPMVVMVSTDWCPPCQMMKKTIMPRVRERGLLRKVAFAMVNPDRDGELAEQITGGGPIPQLVMFRRTAKGWIRQKLIGGQSVETVEEFISEGLAQDAADKADKKASTTKGSKKTSRPDQTSAHRDGDNGDKKAAQHG